MATNTQMLYVSALSIGGITMAGYIDTDGAVFVTESERLEVKAGNSLSTIDRYEIGFKAYIEFTPLSNAILNLLDTAIGGEDHTSFAVPQLALTGTIKDDAGTETALSGMVQFDGKTSTLMKIGEVAKTKLHADFVPSAGVLFTLGEKTYTSF